MELSWTSPSGIIAVLALYVSFANYRRSNFAIIRIRECTWSFCQDVRQNNGQPFHHLRIVIQNLGIPLHNLHMILSFSGSDGLGRFRLPLHVNGTASRREGQFAKGMITEFSLQSYRLEEGDIRFLVQLHDAQQQSASFCLYADSFLVSKYRLDSLLNSAKRLWNWLARGFNCRIRYGRGTNTEGRTFARFVQILPTFKIPSHNVMRFAESLRKERGER